MNDFVAYVDGSSHGNPGHAGIGIVLIDADGNKRTYGRWIGRQDNNVAEYMALLEALQLALELGAQSLRVFSDSEVVVKQMLGEYACRASALYSLNWTCRRLARRMRFSIFHLPREQNIEANELANQAVRERSSQPSFLELGQQFA